MCIVVDLDRLLACRRRPGVQLLCSHSSRHSDWTFWWNSLNLPALFLPPQLLSSSSSWLSFNPSETFLIFPDGFWHAIFPFSLFMLPSFFFPLSLSLLQLSRPGSASQSGDIAFDLTPATLLTYYLTRREAGRLQISGVIVCGRRAFERGFSNETTTYAWRRRRGGSVEPFEGREQTFRLLFWQRRGIKVMKLTRASDSEAL